MGVKEIKASFEAYGEAYMQALRAGAERYAALEKVPWGLIAGPKCARVFVLADGIIFALEPSEVDSFVFSDMMDVKVRPLMTDLCLGNFSFQGPGPLYCELRNLSFRKGGVTREYTLLESSGAFGPSRWSSDIGREHGEEVISGIVLSQILAISQKSGPERITTKFQSIIGDFEELLDVAENEEQVHKFLNKNPIILATDVIKVLSKVKLGTEYVTDFVLVRPENNYVLIEIEPVEFPLFTKAGNLSHQVTHATMQVRSWRRWISDNISYARKQLPGIADPECWVIIGRRSGIPEEYADLLAQHNTDNSHLSIMTYDDLVEKAKLQLATLKALAE